MRKRDLQALPQRAEGTEQIIKIRPFVSVHIAQSGKNKKELVVIEEIIEVWAQ